MASTASEEVLRIETPFAFHDGHPVIVYSKADAGRPSFFDDGETLFTLSLLGLDLVDGRRLRPLRTIAAAHQVNLTDEGEFATYGDADRPFVAFARYCAAMIEVVKWARETAALPADESMLTEEVALYLQAWRPKVELQREVDTIGLSGQRHRFDFSMDGLLIDAIAPRPNASASTIRKIVDVKTSSASPASFLVVIDDRRKPREAEQEARIIGNVADVWPMTRLMTAVGSPIAAQ